MQNLSCNCDDSERIIKNIYVFVNGEKYSGIKVVLNQNRWHHILNQITLKLDPYFGKVEKLYTTTSGLSICSFTDLENNATYVASNRVRRYANVKGGYSFITEHTQEYFEHYLSSQLHRINKNKKLVYVRRDLLVIYIFRNGECGQSFKIVLTSEDLSSWSHILSYIALILDIPERCIKSLYSINGNKICGPWELQHGASYVAVGYNQSFKKGCYHVDQKSTEVLTTGYPVVAKDKNLACTHKIRRKMKQNLSWNHYDQYTCVSPSTRRSSRKSRTGSKNFKPTSSQSYSPDFEENMEENKEDVIHNRMSNMMALQNEKPRNSSFGNEKPRNSSFGNEKHRNSSFGNEKPRNLSSINRKSKDMTLGYATLENNPLANGSSKNTFSEKSKSSKGKKVTVHMRIKNTEASNLTITRNSGDTSSTHKKKKKWDDEDSLNSDTSDTHTHSQLCDCTGETCSTSHQNNKHFHKNKYHSEPTSPGSSETNISSSEEKLKKKGRNLTWQHVKKNETKIPGGNTERVSVHIRGGNAVVFGGSAEDLKGSFDVKKLKQAELKRKKIEEEELKKQAEAEKKAKKAKEEKEAKEAKKAAKAKKYCAPDCGEKDECKFYLISKPNMDKYKPLYCPNTSSNQEPKPKQYNSILKHRDTSKSRLKNRNSVIECEESEKCKRTLKRQSFLKKMSSLFLDGSSSIDSLKGKRPRKIQLPDTDSEDNSNRDENDCPHNLSSCSICRIQQERRKLTKRFK